jgi:hypothetical protein
MASDSKVSLQTPNRHQLSQIGTSAGARIYQEHARSRSRREFSQPKERHGLLEISCADKLRNMPGPIPTLDSSAETEVDIKESMAPSTALIGSDRAQGDSTTRKRAAKHGERVISLNKSTTALLEVFLFDIAKGLLGVGSCIVGTLAKLLRLLYIYWETGKVEVERTLVLLSTH